MSKSFRITAICLAVLAAAMAGATLTGGEQPEIQEIEEAVQQPTVETLAAENTFILRELGGFIAIYIDGELEMITDIPVALMRGVDRQALRDGISAESHEELMKLIEDFDS